MNPASGTIVPGYVYPPGWLQTIYNTANRIPTIVILNPNNGPGTSVDSNYTASVNAGVQAGAKIVGYVYTGYGSRAASTVKTDIDRWYNFYPAINGIFFDEMANGGTSSEINQSADLNNYVHGKKANQTTIGNPGTTTAQSMMTTVDIMVVGETDPAALIAMTQPAWVKT